MADIMHEILFELKSGKIVKSQITDDQFDILKSGNGLSKDFWYEGPTYLGVSTEYSCFDGTQVVKWRKV